LGQLIVLALSGLAELWHLSGLGGNKRRISDRVDSRLLGGRLYSNRTTARRLLQNPKLRQVSRVRREALRHLDQTVRRYPAARPLASFVDLYYRLIGLKDPESLWQLITEMIFGPGDSARLFELQIAMELFEVLEDVGFQMRGPITLIPESASPIGVFDRNGELCRVWWQKNLWDASGFDSGRSYWRRTLLANNLTPSPLIPDFVIDLPQRGGVLVIEVKLVESDRESPQRDGLRDVLMYMKDAEGVPDRSSLRFLVVAWNATGSPIRDDQRVQVASQQTAKETLRGILQGSS
jgi:hypothetical protein